MLVFDEIFEFVLLHAFTNIFSRFHWTMLGSALILAFFSWFFLRRAVPPGEAPGFFGFLFPRNIWLHKSALLDYRFVLFDKLMLGLLIALVTIILASDGAPGIEAVGAAIAEEIAEEVAEVSMGVLLAYTVVLLLVDDLCRYWAHRIMHKSTYLWQFHKVHHSPEVLVPFSQMRTHPVNGIVNIIRSGIAMVTVTGAFVLIFPGDLTVLTILGVNAGRMIFYAMGANLRHSHVWVSFGPWLSHIVISPAQHQIHHSKAPEHLDRNFGSQFAIWDWMFNSLYVPRTREKLDFGIDADSTSRLQSIGQLYVEPFKDAVRVWRETRAPAGAPSVVAESGEIQRGADCAQACEAGRGASDLR